MITDDPIFRAEYTPPSILELRDKLLKHFKIPPSHIGVKGDADHRRGYHRSRAFITNSRYCRDRFYSVTEPGNRAGDPNWICAIDISLPNGPLVAMCKRLDTAVRAGKLPQVAEWYGNLGGDARVDGYNAIARTMASSDSSHLWHAHISFVRGHAGDDHSNLLEVLTGEDEDDVDEKTMDAIAARVWSRAISSKAFDKGQVHSAHEGVINSIIAARASVEALVTVRRMEELLAKIEETAWGYNPPKKP